MNQRPFRCESLSEHLRPGYRVFVAGLTGESAQLRKGVTQFPQRASGADFTSIQLPGIGWTDYVGTHPQARSHSFFMTRGVCAGLADGRAALLPLDYTGIAHYLRDSAPFDCAIAQFMPPDSEGWCSAGPSSDFTPLVWKRALRKVGHLNLKLLRINGAARFTSPSSTPWWRQALRCSAWSSPRQAK
jgi:acyl-CoA hydrolase